MTLTDNEFLLILNYVRGKFGLNMENKKYLVEIRLESELKRCGCTSFSQYWQRLKADELDTVSAGLCNCLTTNYTYFCREADHFSYLKTELIEKNRRSLSVWCAGCASGQESYTLAMLMAESRDSGRFLHDFHIIATDLSAEAIETAQTGIYNRADYERLPEVWKNRYCLLQSDDSFIVNTRIRDKVRYVRQNLMDSRPGTGKFDIVFCRNVLIYFREEERSVVVNNLIEAMRPGGLLFIGHAESLMRSESCLEYVKPAIYRKPEAIQNAEK